MSRHNYNDDSGSDWAMICWRGAVERAILGQRGQQLLKELLHALDAMPVKCLIAEDLERDGLVCALGAVGQARGIEMSHLDPEEPEDIAAAFNIAPALAREIMYINDDRWYGLVQETDAARFLRVRRWVCNQIPKEDQNKRETPCE